MVMSNMYPRPPRKPARSVMMPQERGEPNVAASGSNYALDDFGGGKVTDRGIKREGDGWKNQ